MDGFGGKDTWRHQIELVAMLGEGGTPYARTTSSFSRKQLGGHRSAELTRPLGPSLYRD